MILVTDEEYNSCEKEKACYICKKELGTDEDDENAFELYHKFRDHCHFTRKFRAAAHSICNLRHKTPKEISTVFHNGSAYDYHFIINQLAKKCKSKLECLGENTEKYITFAVPISKILDNVKRIKYKLKFIDNFRFMSTSLWKLIKYLSERLHSFKSIDCKSKLDYMSFKDDQLTLSVLSVKKVKKDFNKELIKRFANTYDFFNGDID